MLKVVRNLPFDTDAVTQKFAWLGRSGSGKTYGAKRFVEQMLHLSAQVLVVDTVGVWSGLRNGPKGFNIPILGGLHGDIELEPTSGELVGEVAVKHGTSLVLDTSQMSDADRARFMTGFGKRLFELKKSAPGAMHVLLDEAQDVVPQNPQNNENNMLHEWVRIAKQGRAFGIGLSLVSQRPQELNKKALNQAECVLAFQLTGPQERKALEYWLSDKGLEAKSLEKLLPTLEVGKPFVWSPQWLKVAKISEGILAIESADTSQTPKVGDKRVATDMRPVDLGALRESMAAMVQHSQDNDPKHLKARIQVLEARLEQSAPQFSKEQRLAARALTDRLQASDQNMKRMLGNASQLLKTTQQHIQDLSDLLLQSTELAGSDELIQLLSGFFEDVHAVGTTFNKLTHANKKLTQTSPAPKPTKPAPINTSDLPRCDALLLQVLAQHGEMHLHRLAMLAGYPPRASTARNAIGRLRTLGYAEGPNSRVAITKLGRKHCVQVEALPQTGAERAAWWYEKLPKVDAALLRAIIKHRRPCSLTEASFVAGYDPSVSTTRNAAGRLRTLGLIEGKNTHLVAHQDLRE